MIHRSDRKRAPWRVSTGLALSALVAAFGCGDDDERRASDAAVPEQDARAPELDAALDADVIVDARTDGMVDAIVPDAAGPTDGGTLSDGGTCPSGYVVVNDACVDVDECAPGGGAICSAPEEFCVNLPGSFDCTCQLGKELVGGVCVDIDECARGTAVCEEGVPCVNTDPFYRCGSCPAGTTGGGAGGCMNVDECQAQNACLPGATCTDAAPTAEAPNPYSCSCPSGFEGNGRVGCTDIDECARGTDNCPDDATCDGLTPPGSFTCACPSGMRLTPNETGLQCVDVDECAESLDDCDPRVACDGTGPGWTCAPCSSLGNYTGDPSTAEGCVDVDECCSDPTDLGCVRADDCMGLASCINEPGTFRCGNCPAGTVLNGNVCDELDECALGTHGCGPNAVCANVDHDQGYGGWDCECPTGWRGNPDPLSGCVVNPASTPKLSSGYTHTCAVVSGAIECWGAPIGETPPAGNDYVEVVNGQEFSCARRADKSVQCWGVNNAGQAPAVAPGRFRQLSASYANVCGILESDRTVACWGSNASGQSAPPAGTTFAEIAAGTNHVCGLRPDGSVQCWGASNAGQAASPPPAIYSGVSAGAEHSCALRNDGVAVCWGSNAEGQVSPPATGAFVQVQAGGYHTCGLRPDGTVGCWGLAEAGRTTPPAGRTFGSTSASFYHTCGITVPPDPMPNQYDCWGDDRFGQAEPPAPPPP